MLRANGVKGSVFNGTAYAAIEAGKKPLGFGHVDVPFQRNDGNLDLVDDVVGKDVLVGKGEFKP